MSTSIIALIILAILGTIPSWRTIAWEWRHGLGSAVTSFLLWLFIILAAIAIISYISR